MYFITSLTKDNAYRACKRRNITTTGNILLCTVVWTFHPRTPTRSLTLATTDKSCAADSTFSSQCKMGEDNITDHTNQVAENGQANQTPDDTEEDDNDDMDDCGKVFLIDQHTEITFVHVNGAAYTIMFCQDHVI